MFLQIYLEKKGEKTNLSDTTTQILYCTEAPLAGVAASSLLGYDATIFAHLYLGIFCHSSQQILLSSARLEGDYQWTGSVIRCLQRCSIGFKSCLWLRPLENINTVVSEPLLSRLGCVLRVTVQLESEQLVSGAWFLPDTAFRTEAKHFNIGCIRPANLVSHSLGCGRRCVLYPNG